MTTYRTLKMGERIESPISAFNNFLLDIGKKLNELFDCNIYGDNNCLFEDDSILIFGFVKLLKNKDSKLSIRFIGDIDDSNINICNKVFESRNELNLILNQFIFIKNDITKNYDDSINHSIVENIISKVNSNNVCLQILPFKNKINKQLDGSIETILDRISFALKIEKSSNVFYNAQILRLESSILDESISLENIRFLEKEIMMEGTINKENLNKFVTKLIYYGEIEF